MKKLFFNLRGKYKIKKLKNFKVILLIFFISYCDVGWGQSTLDCSTNSPCDISRYWDFEGLKYGTLGNLVSDIRLPAGVNEHVLSTALWPSGVYHYQLIGDTRLVQKGQILITH